MWRVSNGTHELWILATLVPLPRHMTWRSHVVENRIALSQVVLAPPEIMADIDFFGNPIYAQNLVQAQTIPNQGGLKQILPNDIYVRWLAVKNQYLGSAYSERTRPLLDALRLYQGAVEQSGLTTDESVWRTVERISHQNHVKIVPTVVNLKMDSPAVWIHEFVGIPLSQEQDCLEKTIERVETDIEPMRHRANLWSVGDVEGLRALTYADDRITCFNTLFSVPKFHAEIGQAVAEMYNEWLAAAETALSQNTSSFAVLPISELLKADGWLDRLRAKGYDIKEP
jgi:TraB/PrgY/gumN family